MSRTYRREELRAVKRQSREHANLRKYAEDDAGFTYRKTPKRIRLHAPESDTTDDGAAILTSILTVDM